jgi:hypothetical protein
MNANILLDCPYRNLMRPTVKPNASKLRSALFGVEGVAQAVAQNIE